jgi:hypothetical protein
MCCSLVESSGLNIPWTDQKFGHGIGLAQLAVGMIGLGAVAAGGGLYVARYHQRATSKFVNSLVSMSRMELAEVGTSILPRGHMTIGIMKEPMKKLNLRDAFRAVALIGDHRSGKTVFLSHVISTTWFRGGIVMCFLLEVCTLLVPQIYQQLTHG